MSNPSIPIPSSKDGIPDILAALNVSRDYSPPAAENLFLYVLGLSGTGKSSFAFGVENALFLDIEDGGHSVPYKEAWWCRCPVVTDADLTDALKNPLPGDKRPPAVSLATAMAKLRELARLPSNPVKTVIFDSADKLQQLTKLHLEKKWGSDVENYRGGKGGWGILNTETLAPILEAKKLGYGVIVLGHLKSEWKEVNKVEVEIIRAGVTAGVDSILRANSDYTLSVAIGEKFVQGQGSTSNYILLSKLNKEKRGHFDMKTRVALPEVVASLPLEGGFKKFKAEYDKAVAAMTSKLSQRRTV